MRIKHYNKIKSGKMTIKDRSRLNEDIRSRKDGDYYFVIKEEEPTIDDQLRKYYFSQVVELIAEEIPMLPADVHTNMKIKFASYLCDRTGMTIVHSIFSDESTMGVAVKRKFINKVKQWAYEFLNITFPEKGEAEDDH